MSQAERFLEAIDRFTCPKCKARRGFRCVYLNGAKEGQYTKQPHWERVNKLYWEEIHRRQAEWQEQQDIKTGNTPERRAILRAYAEQNRREHEALRIWLRRYSSVLTVIN